MENTTKTTTETVSSPLGRVIAMVLDREPDWTAKRVIEEVYALTSAHTTREDIAVATVELMQATGRSLR